VTLNTINGVGQAVFSPSLTDGDKTPRLCTFWHTLQSVGESSHWSRTVHWHLAHYPASMTCWFRRHASLTNLAHATNHFHLIVLSFLNHSFGLDDHVRKVSFRCMLRVRVRFEPNKLLYGYMIAQANTFWHGTHAMGYTSFWVSVLKVTPNHTPLKCGCPIKLTNQINHGYFKIGCGQI
jgi:hypothetical protein